MNPFRKRTIQISCILGVLVGFWAKLGAGQESLDESVKDRKSPESAFPVIERDWTEAGEKGRKIRGSVLKVNPNHVLMKLADSGKEKLIKKSQLSKLDLAYLELVPMIQNDNSQYEQTKSTWDAMPQGQFPSVKVAKQYQTSFPKSPYGLLMAGIATACTTPDYEEAESYFEKAYKSLQAKEQLLPDLTPATYVTCCNNYAIVMWREGNANTAVKLLAEAAAIGPQPAAFLIHNAKIIQAENGKRSEKYQVSKKALTTLDELVNKPFASTREKLKNGVMHFSLSVDPPPAISDLDALLELHFAGEKMIDERFLEDPAFSDLMASKNCPYEPWCMSCGGKGVFRCPGRCNRGTISVPIQTLEARGIRGEPVYGTRYEQKACPACNGRGVGERCDGCQGTGRNR